MLVSIVTTFGLDGLHSIIGRSKRVTKVKNGVTVPAHPHIYP